MNNYRIRSPQDTYDQIKSHLAHFGITRLANITGLDKIGIPVYLATRPNSRSLSLSQGKGMDKISAKVSAMMEAIEGFHAENIEADLILESVNGMTDLGMHTIDWEQLPRLNNSEICLDKKALWIKGTEILSGKYLYVPYEVVHTDYRLPKPPSLGWFAMNSNGLASGNTIEEATSHALCELIERDSYSCWSVAGSIFQKDSKVNLKTIDCPDCNSLIRKFNDADVLVGVWNITSDLKVPTFLARVINREGPPSCVIRPASGFGTHPDKNVALIRALTEAAQSRLTFIAGGRDDIRSSHYRSYLCDAEYDKWRQSILAPTNQNFNDLHTTTFSNVDQIYDHLVETLREANFKEIISLNLVKNDIGIAVVKILVPGLEGAESYSVVKPGLRALQKKNGNR